jgi:hypothetical protein
MGLGTNKYNWVAKGKTPAQIKAQAKVKGVSGESARLALKALRTFGKK